MLGLWSSPAESRESHGVTMLGWVQRGYVPWKLGLARLGAGGTDCGGGALGSWNLVVSGSSVRPAEAGGGLAGGNGAWSCWGG